MTRAIRDRILKDANGDISGHLRNHIHLTNCIHLKNHMHKHSPILADRAIMRDFIVLQKSRSLRDPSTSPPSWHSPSVVDLLSKKAENDAVSQEGRSSVGIEPRQEGRRFSGSSPANLGTSKVAHGEIVVNNLGIVAVSEHRRRSGLRDGRRVKRGESGQRSMKTELLDGNEEASQDQDVNDSVNNLISGKSESKDKKVKQKGRLRQDFLLKTLSEQLEVIPADTNDIASSHVHLQGRCTRLERTGEEPEAIIHGYCSGLNRIKKRKFHGARRSRAAIGLTDIGAQNELSVASNSLAEGSVCPKNDMEEEREEYGEQNVTRAPRNGCGIPWNWSRIHHRGITFLDMAGRSLSCGLSDSRINRGGSVPHGRDVSGMPMASDHCSASTKSGADALPLLGEASGSQESSENVAWVHDYSGELGIFADNLLRHGFDSGLASAARSGDQRKFRGYRPDRHQNLTQKYMPRTFEDLVGQNLVAQALSNAVVKRKVGVLYVFYGPHGTGKTSCARIFARALNCQSVEHLKPCGTCNSCIAHDMGKSRNIREVGPVSNMDIEGVMNLINNAIASQQSAQYRVFIFDGCDALSPDCWSAISKVIDQAPRRIVLVLVSSTLDVLPHIIISRCQKFFFPKLKDADIIYTLQQIVNKEHLEIEKDALKLIASRSDGSLRDAEMTLEQLSLLGQRISVPLVQELVGLISDEKLVDLLDLALSTDMVNTVKNLREIMETGVEPLDLMSQLATVITDILAGSYDFTKERLKRKFFRRAALSKEDMEKLRQALKTLSEAEKQLRMSNEKLTWLTAALLQLAPDQQYMLPSSSADTSFNHSPLVPHTASRRDIVRKGSVSHVEMPNNGRSLSTNVRIEKRQAGGSGDFFDSGMMKHSCIDRKKHAVSGMARQPASAHSADTNRLNCKQIPDKLRKEIEDIWLEALEKIQIVALKEFLYKEGKLISVSIGAAPTVQLMLSSHLNKSKAEKCRGHILQAFESILGSPVSIEIRCKSRQDAKEGAHVPLTLSVAEDFQSQMDTTSGNITDNRWHQRGYDDISQSVPRDRNIHGVGSSHAQLLNANSLEMGSGIVEVLPSPRELKSSDRVVNNVQSDKTGLESSWAGDASSSHRKSSMASISEKRKFGEQSHNQSLIRSKVSLAHLIQHADGCSQRSGWSKHKAVSIAEKLERENLRLEARSRILLCWKASKVTRCKLSRFKIRTRRPQSLLKLMSCGRCLSSKSPR